ncbi:fibronectin type III domain-containing protein [Halomarina rubra]|uniref:Fibronectin type-III domain-containing protein n=1 Tax=Halomarina rubra TaxID=2071873 RepID=A0ABD6AS37_9EURY|nr:fibronectin type III domain-containing protein [Halomarina rubra]
MPITATTELRDITDRTLDSSTEDQLSHSWDVPTGLDYGDVRVQYRVSGEQTFIPVTENRFGGRWNNDVTELGAADGFAAVGEITTTSGTYNDIFTSQFTTDSLNLPADTTVYMTFYAKWPQRPKWGAEGEWVVDPEPDSDRYQRYVLRNDAQNARDEFFRLYYADKTTGFTTRIANPSVMVSEPLNAVTNGTSVTLGRLVDGEKYDVRSRVETEHVTGPWTTLNDITAMPSVGNIAIDAAEEASVSLSWSDRVDNEDHYVIQRAEQVAGSYGLVEDVETLGQGTTSYVDNSSRPSTTYQYRVQAQTEHRSSTSTWAETTTPSTTQGQRRAPRRGWHVEVVHPSTGRIIRPSVVGEPEREPAVNDLPRIRIPVPRDEKWLADEWDDAELRVWYDGERQPIERLEATLITPESVVLEGRGGLDLLERVTAEFDVEEAHVAAESLLTDTVGADVDVVVDDPALGVREDEILQDANGEAGIRDLLVDAIGETDPLAYQNDRLEQLPVSYIVETENADTLDSSSAVIDETQDWSANGAARLNSIDGRIRHTFTTEYTIPEEHVRVLFRSGSADSDALNVSWRLDGQEVGNITFADGIGKNLNWGYASDISGPGWTGGDLQPGEHTVEVFVDDYSSGQEWYSDVLGIVDARYVGNASGLDNTRDGNYMADPPLFATDWKLEFEDAVVTKAIDEATATLDLGDDTGQTLELSFDDGVSWSSGGAPTHTATNGSLSNQVRLRTTLTATGTNGGQTPTENYQGNHLAGFELRGDIDETPLVVERSYDGSLLDALRDIADVSSSAFEFRWDDGPAVHWTRIGQRSSTVDVDPSNYDVQRSRENLIASAEVHGAAQAIVREPITAAVGQAVALDHGLVQEGSVNVYDPDTDEVFEEGLDYSVGYREGIVTAHGEGTLADGQLVLADYSYKPRGSYTAEGVTGREIVRDVPGATNDRMCEQLAERLVEDLSVPQVEAEVTLPVSSTGWSVIDELSIPGVPIGESLHLRQARLVPGQTSLTLGTRRTVSEAVQQLRDRIQTNSRRV